MTQDQLKQMIEIANTGSINRAAANLFMSQPNLSLSIKNLEIELGCTLINRSSQGTTLTEKGESFVTYARDIIAQMDYLSAIGRNDSVSVPTLYVSSELSRVVEKVLAVFFNSIEGEKPRIINYEASREQIIKHVEDGMSEIGFVVLLSTYQKEEIRMMKSRGIKFYPLSPGEPVAVIGEKNPLFDLGNMAAVEANQLNPFPQAKTLGNDYGHFNDKRRLLGITEEKDSILFNSADAAFTFVENTDAYLLTTHHRNFYKTHDYRPNLHKLFIKDAPFTCIFGYIIKEDASLSPLAAAFLEEVKKNVM